MGARNCTVLDSACTSTVCGKEWLNWYLDSLSQIRHQWRRKLVQNGLSLELGEAALTGMLHYPCCIGSQGFEDQDRCGRLRYTTVAF